MVENAQENQRNRVVNMSALLRLRATGAQGSREGHELVDCCFRDVAEDRHFYDETFVHVISHLFSHTWRKVRQ